MKQGKSATVLRLCGPDERAQPARRAKRAHLRGSEIAVLLAFAGLWCWAVWR